MNTMYILRAMPGSGKSTFISENGLEANTLSLDTFRILYEGLDTGMYGEPSVSQKNGANIVNKYMDALKQRLGKGGDLFLDNLNIRYGDIKTSIDLAKKYGYKTKIVEFPFEDFDFYMERNKNRPEHKRLSESTLKRWFDAMKETNKDFYERDLEFIKPEDALKEVFTESQDLVVDLNEYKKIHHIGDLQGTYQPLKDYLQKNGGIKDDEFYIFVGDYVDRGIENHLVVKWLLEEAVHKDNIVLLKGNHERHIINYAFDIVKPSNEFLYGTLPQLKREGIDKKELQELSSHFQSLYCYEYNDKKVMVTHAGLGNVVKFPNMISESEFLYGYGGYGFDIDTLFTENNKDTEWYQVHGHRNYKDRKVNLELKSYSLESDVEFNGYLSCLTLDDAGFKASYIPSNVYNKEKLNDMENGMFVDRKYEDLEKFITLRLSTHKSPMEMLESLRSNDLIREKEFGHVSSFNFTRKAFFDKSFGDELVSTSRGLFVNNETGEIVARGYDKFFNIDEQGVEISKMDNIEKHTAGPYVCYEKENGFLGIVGYDSKTDQLFVASKSTPESDFAGWFREILEEQVGLDGMEKIKTDLKKHNASAVFEVNDPINDPHIVEYDKRHVVLLDVIKREYEFRNMRFDHLQKMGEKWDLTVKKRGPQFNSFENFKKFYEAVTTEDPFLTNKKLEGYVIVDSNNNMNKIKLPFYNFWKEMRGLKDKVVSSVKKGNDYDLDAFINRRHLLANHKEQAKDFMTWLVKNKDIETIGETNVISLRNDYLESQKKLEQKSENNLESKRSKHLKI